MGLAGDEPAAKVGAAGALGVDDAPTVKVGNEQVHLETKAGQNEFFVTRALFVARFQALGRNQLVEGQIKQAFTPDDIAKQVTVLAVAGNGDDFVNSFKKVTTCLD